MKITVRIEGMKEINQALKKIREDARRKYKQEVYGTAVDIQGQAKDNLKALEAWDLGNLSSSIEAESTSDGLTAEIGPVAPYGPYVEFGTKKHFPPLEALEGWAKRHGFDSAWPICKAIAERGLPARPYLWSAWLSYVDVFYNKAKKILEG